MFSSGLCNSVSGLRRPPLRNDKRHGSFQASLDDEQARRVRLLLHGKGVVSAHRIERPLAAGMDDEQQSPSGGANAVGFRLAVLIRLVGDVRRAGDGPGRRRADSLFQAVGRWA
jgi:hypothetical protein